MRRVARGLRAALVALGAAAVAGSLAAIALRCLGRPWPVSLSAGLPLGGALLGAIWSLVYQSRSLTDAALALEERYGLKTLLTTALALEAATTPGRGAPSFTQAILDDAEARARDLSPGAIVEWNLRRPASFAFGALLMVSATTLYFPELDLFDRREGLAVEENQRERRREEARRLEDLARKLDAPVAEEPIRATAGEDIAGDLERLADSLRDPKLGREDAMLRVSDLEQKVKEEREALKAKEPELNAMALKNLKTGEARSLALAIMNRDFAGASDQAGGLAEALRSGRIGGDREKALGSDLQQLSESLQGNAEVANNLGAAGDSLEAGLSGAGAEHLDNLAESLSALARSAEAGRALAAASEALDRTRQALSDVAASGAGEAGEQGASGASGEGQESSLGEPSSGASGEGSQTDGQQGAVSQDPGAGAESGAGAQGASAGQGSSEAGETGAQSGAGSQSGGAQSGAGGEPGTQQGGGEQGQAGASGQNGASGEAGASGQQGQSGESPSGGSPGSQQGAGQQGGGGQSGAPSGGQAGGGQQGAGQQGTQPNQGGTPGGGQGQQQQQGGGWGQTPPSGASQGDGGQQGGQSGQQGGQQGGPSGGQSGQSGQSGQQGGGGAQAGQSGAAGSAGGGQAASGGAGAAGGASGTGGTGGATDWGVGSTNLEQSGGGEPTGAETGGRQADGSKAGWEERFMSLYRERNIQAQTMDGQVQGQYGEGEELGWRSVDGQVERREPTALQGDLFMETRIREKQSLDQQDIPFEYKDSVRRYFDSIEVPNR